MSQILIKARATKNDAFYTRYSDVENELQHYDFRGKVVYCNCDSPKSNFYKYFKENFHKLGLKCLYISWLQSVLTDAKAIKFDGEETVFTLARNGSFDTCELIELADIVVTNPPFSLIRHFFDHLLQHNKDFLIVAPVTAFAYKDILPHVQAGRVWAGHNGVKQFDTPQGERAMVNTCWMTNAGTRANHTYTLVNHHLPTLHNFDALFVDKLAAMPDHSGLLAVPITYLVRQDDRFEILGTVKEVKSKYLKVTYPPAVMHKDGKVFPNRDINRTPVLHHISKPNGTYYTIDGECGYFTSHFNRILIRRKHAS